MSQFSNTFSLDEIRQRLVAQISWRSIITIMSKCKEHNKSNSKIGVSKYKYIEELGEYLEKRLKEIGNYED